MSMSRIWVVPIAAALLLATTAVSHGQAYEDPNGAVTESRTQAADELTFLFTPKILTLVTHRIADEMGKHYEFDPEQVEATRVLLEDRFPQWFMENRQEIMRLTNQYVEAMLGDEPPTPVQVAEWTKRAHPLISEFAEEVRTTTEDMRVYLDDEQQIKLDQEMAAFEVAMGYMDNRMQTWSAGGYDPATEFPGSPVFHEQERQRQERLRAEQHAARQAIIQDLEQGLAPDPASAADRAMGEENAVSPRTAGATGPRDEWAAYVESFIKRYALNEAQQNSAYAQLEKYQKLRDVYLHRKFDQLKELQRLLANASSAEDREKVKKRYDALNEPVDRYFARLKSQLERLPTRRQRELAEPAGPETRPRALAESDKTAAAVE